MNPLTRSPNKYVSVATVKNRNPRPRIDAVINGNKPTCHTPAAIVNTLYGMGVKAAAKIAKNAFSLNNSPTVMKCCSYPKLCMIALPILSNKNIPMKYPKIPPSTEKHKATKAYQYDCFGLEMDKDICKTSGGMGKKEDSINANIARAGVAYFDSVHDKTQR